MEMEPAQKTTPASAIQITSDCHASTQCVLLRIQPIQVFAPLMEFALPQIVVFVTSGGLA